MYVSLLLVLSQLVGPISCGSHQLVRGRKHTPVRASTLMVLNNYIAIISTTKYQNVPYNGGAKAIFFGSIATVHSYFWLYTVAKRLYIYIICTFILLLIILLICILSFILIFLLPHSLSIYFSLPPGRFTRAQLPQTHRHQPMLQLVIASSELEIVASSASSLAFSALSSLFQALTKSRVNIFLCLNFVTISHLSLLLCKILNIIWILTNFSQLGICSLAGNWVLLLFLSYANSQLYAIMEFCYCLQYVHWNAFLGLE